MARPTQQIGPHASGCEYAETLTLSADIVFAVPCRRIYVGTGGNVKVRMATDSTEHVYKNIANGGDVIGRFSAVIITGGFTTAADLIAEW